MNKQSLPELIRQIEQWRLKTLKELEVRELAENLLK
jgi:hypothetical protein